MQRHQRQHRGKIAARAIATHRNAGAVYAKALCLGTDVAIGSGGILDRCRVAMFRRQAIINCNH